MSINESPAHEDTLPELKYEVVPSSPSDDRVEALKLIADSVAQQRQLASKAIILHPAILAAAVVVIAILARFLELYTLVTTTVGLTMSAMLGVRWYTAAYISIAEGIGFKWLQDTTRPRSNSNGSISGSPNGNGNGNRDPIVLIARGGNEIIGALVLRVMKRERKGYVRAWTVKMKYRHKGVGRGLLEEGAKAVWGKGGRGMQFEDDHANAGRALPEYFNGGFDKNEAKGREMLAEVVAETRKERSSR